MNRNILILLLFLFIAAPHQAFAARCDAAYEVIVTPYEPTFGVPSVWDAEYRQEGKMVQFFASTPLDGGTVLTYGRVLSEEDFQPEQTILVELNKRGRALITREREAGEAELPTDIIPLSKGFVTSSDIRAGRKKELRQVRLSFYNEKVEFRKNVILKDERFDYESLGLLPAIEGQGFIAYLRAENRDDPQDFNSVVMRFDENGTMLWRRAYRPGIPNALFGIVPIDNKTYLATGHIEIEDGRMAGWALKLGIDGTVYWQRTYPRGVSSQLIGGAEVTYSNLEGMSYVLIGNSEPLDRGPRATWVMSIDTAGEPVWQRYFRRDDYKLTGKALHMHEDGRLVILMNAEANEKAIEPSHIRLVTLSPRGAMIQDESYLSGIEATANDFDNGWQGERIVTATIRKVPTPPAEEDIIGSGLFNLQEPAGPPEQPETDEDGNVIQPDPVTKGWVFVGTALDPYDDPCRMQ